MSSFVKFTAILGAHDQGPLCYLLEIDEAKLLLDCGWSESTDPSQLAALEKVARQIDALLLSHADLDHLGAFPYAAKHLGLTCPVFATTPVHDMGQACMHDLIQAKLNQEEFHLFTKDDIDTAFAKTTILRYSQPTVLTGKCQGITVSAFSAGHTIGGTIWKIKKDTEEIVYAVDYNHRKERHLNGTVLLSTDTLIRPTLLITDAFNTLMPDPAPRKQRDAALIESIATVLSEHGNVLIPSDSSTRVLELLYMLDQHWAFHRYTYHLVFLTNQSQNAINLAKSTLEWMGDGIAQAFTARELPFEFKCLKMIHSIDELDNLMGPKVVLASFPGMMTGFSQDLLIEWGSDPRNMIILPDRAQPGTLGRMMFDDWFESAKMADMNLKKQVPLVGDELDEYMSKKQAEEEHARLMHSHQLGLDDSSDSDMSDTEEVAKPQPMQFDIYVKDVNRSTGFFKQAQAFKMYPVHEHRPRVDDYGELIDLDMYAKLELQHNLAPNEPEENEKVVAPVKKVVPSKYVVEDILLSLKCRMQYIDFEGRSDGKSVKNIIAQVAPRKLLFVHGDKASTMAFAEYCRTNESLTNEVYDPVQGECVNVSSATNLFRVVLTDTLMDEYSLSYITGVIKLQDSVTGGTRAMLEVVPVETQLTRQHVMVVGEAKLSQVRKVLDSQGFRTAFASGVLVVNEGKALIKRSGTDGSLALEGSISRDYYKIRELLYSTLAIL
ncbi:hypothetical protein BATDEDRAFT_12823 [Batrachochytrium dendrobatidis JAM81]|uniref:Cleavage and polyadenylation specificity factor subunit 2 n=1 Tax=Batrachochytrium dendrobatidis (strain JAM81 / FGSC 10211) TaxID=684364 RepID=F4P771_BATDJ|nr:uncharacterized protein BATDEDRAFT_12823 [Batrachochytrium dendrobatidis JAM81]EGF79032.1 hypothetical protein BATDEDRAFT_12823 [Batrachochytrium dendrobatidis JAM81]|eukprot:XP_006680263.1 hypothetical protein BATDEDRAFT_12823 [Batrachochytrium dendrobatidis JAM81]